MHKVKYVCRFRSSTRKRARRRSPPAFTRSYRRPLTLSLPSRCQNYIARYCPSVVIDLRCYQSVIQHFNHLPSLLSVSVSFCMVFNHFLANLYPIHDFIFKFFLWCWIETFICFLGLFSSIWISHCEGCFSSRSIYIHGPRWNNPHNKKHARWLMHFKNMVSHRLNTSKKGRRRQLCLCIISFQLPWRCNTLKRPTSFRVR